MRVLYLDIDSLRADHLGCYGYHRPTTPVFDGLAARGARFEGVYASDVPCLPSRTALFTGRPGIQTGVVNHGGRCADPWNLGPLRQGGNRGPYRTWMTALRQAGYYPASVTAFATRHRDNSSTQWTLLMAGTVIATLPVIIVFLVGQRFFVRGITMTGIK